MEYAKSENELKKTKGTESSKVIFVFTEDEKEMDNQSCTKSYMTCLSMKYVERFIE